MSLADRRCKPGAGLLDTDELAQMREQLPDWRVAENRRISKTFLFPDFQSALNFTNRAGAVAEAEGHHPEICLSWGRVDVQTWTHDAGGLTENDFILAAKIDQAYFAR
jgi:4a-hydroxytetrahydrobiopterin dehydratase